MIATAFLTVKHRQQSGIYFHFVHSYVIISYKNLSRLLPKLPIGSSIKSNSAAQTNYSQFKTNRIRMSMDFPILNKDDPLNLDRSRLFEHLRQQIKDKRVISTLEMVPRELFLPPSQQQYAYQDKPLPIDKEQTISQPTIVAIMTDALDLQKTDRVLEVGTGSGYQTAILAEMADFVVSVERHQKLLLSAHQILKRQGYNNIELHFASQILGWPAGAPYNKILVTAGAPQVPQDLLDQLEEGGRLVIPVGSEHEQELLRLIKKKGKINTKSLGGCRFVPLIAREAWNENTPKTL